MKLKNISTVVLIFLATGLISLGFFSNAFTKKRETLLSFNKGESYEKLWKRVDSCENKGLTESALKIVNGISTQTQPGRF